MTVRRFHKIAAGFAALATLGTACSGEASLEQATGVSYDPSAAALVYVAPESAPSAESVSPGAGSVVIETLADFSFGFPMGSFEVTEGADVLGCSSGRFFETGNTDGNVTSLLRCEAGDRTGNFEVQFRPRNLLAGLDADGSPWTIVGGSGDFEELGGGGESSWNQNIANKTAATTRTGRIWFGAEPHAVSTVSLADPQAGSAPTLPSANRFVTDVESP